MSTRLILLIVVAGGLAIAFAVKSSSPPSAEAEADSATKLDGAAGVSLEEYRLLQTALADRPLAGSEPEVPPEFVLDVSVDRTGRKNRIYVDISEVHGYYVETFRLLLYYKPTPDTTVDDSPLKIDHFVDRFLPANETLRVCFDVVPAELGRIGGALGGDDNWGAVVVSYNRARAQNPDPLPKLPNAFDCD